MSRAAPNSALDLALAIGELARETDAIAEQPPAIIMRALGAMGRGLASLVHNGGPLAPEQPPVMALPPKPKAPRKPKERTARPPRAGATDRPAKRSPGRRAMAIREFLAGHPRSTWVDVANATTDGSEAEGKRTRVMLSYLRAKGQLTLTAGEKGVALWSLP